jgi:hypothetical protein
MKLDEQLVSTALRSWNQVVERIASLCHGLGEDGLFREIAPGKNRVIYLWGHLAAIHDAMLPTLRLGDRLHPELDAVFVSNPDKASPLPSAGLLKTHWAEIHATLLARLSLLTPSQWLERHGNVSAEEFAVSPERNRLSVLLSRTNHASYHLGQMMLAEKKKT